MKKTIWFDATESRYHTEDARQFLPVRLREEKGRYYHPLNYFKSQGRSSGWVIRFGCSARLGCRSCRWIIIRMIYTIVAILRSLLTSTMICPVCLQQLQKFFLHYLVMWPNSLQHCIGLYLFRYFTVCLERHKQWHKQWFLKKPSTVP